MGRLSTRQQQIIMLMDGGMTLKRNSSCLIHSSSNCVSTSCDGQKNPQSSTQYPTITGGQKDGYGW